MSTRTEIILEMERCIIVNRPSRKRWCSECSLFLEMLSVDDAALYAHVNSRTIFRWAESGKVHSIETPEGLLLICPISLNVTR